MFGCSPKTVQATPLVFRALDRPPKTVQATLLVFRGFKPPSGTADLVRSNLPEIVLGVGHFSVIIYPLGWSVLNYHIQTIGEAPNSMSILRDGLQ